MADDLIGEVGIVTGMISPQHLGEVIMRIRGGTEAFYAHAEDRASIIPKGSRVVVRDYFPPRTVIVAPLPYG